MPKFLANSLYLRGKERDKRQKFFIHITAIVSLRGGYETEDTGIPAGRQRFAGIFRAKFQAAKK